MGTYSSACQLIPSSTLRSTNDNQGPSSWEAGASQSPLLSTMALFFTGPRPPRSPGTSSIALFQVLALSVETVYQVSQVGISFPTLKYNITLPSGALNRTGFQWGSSRSLDRKSTRLNSSH